MNIRFPTERTKTFQLSFVTCVLAAILILIGTAMLAVGVWARTNNESFAGDALVMGGVSVVLGMLMLLACYIWSAEPRSDLIG